MSHNAELRQGIFELLSSYWLTVTQTPEFIDVDGGEDACPLRVHIYDYYVVIQAGSGGEAVFEVTTDRASDREFILTALGALLRWEDLSTVQRVALGQLSEYRPYRQVLG